MTVKDWVLQRFASSERAPVAGKVFNRHATEFDERPDYSYEAMNLLLDDGVITGMVNLIADMVKQSYNGVYLEPLDPYLEAEVTPRELEVLKLSRDFSKRLNVKKLFYDIAYDLVLYGDVVNLIVRDGEGIFELTPVPNNSLFFVEDANQIQDTAAQVKVKNILCVKASQTDTDPAKYKLEDFSHISYKNRNVWREDIDGRNTYGIYSIPILANLQNLIKWKVKTMENDIIWKNKAMPRLIHRLDLSEIVPSKYTGTESERLEKAARDAQSTVDRYIASTKMLRPDDDLVESQAVETTVLESSSTTYQDPNLTMDQINSSINRPLGIPHSLLGGDGSSGVGLETIANFANLKIEGIGQIIADEMTKILQTHLRIVSPSLDEEISRVYYAIHASLITERFTDAKTALAMSNALVFTKTEIRQAIGYPRLPVLPPAAYVEPQNNAKSSNEEVLKNIEQEEADNSNNNNTPNARRASTESRR